MVCQDNPLEQCTTKCHHIAKESVNVQVSVISNHAINGVDSDKNIVPMMHMHPTLPWLHVEELVYPCGEQ